MRGDLQLVGQIEGVQRDQQVGRRS